MVQLQDLGTFVTVAAERSFSVAAKKLHRTQPAVSQAIRRLEEELGDRLFDRSVRNGALTEAGRLLQEYAGRLLAQPTRRTLFAHIRLPSGSCSRSAGAE